MESINNNRRVDFLEDEGEGIGDKKCRIYSRGNVKEIEVKRF